MIRISTIFIAICMVLVAASLGLILYSGAGFSGTESAIVALTPPLIVTEDEIGEIIAKVAKVIRAVA